MTKYDLAARLELAGLHGYTGRLPAKQQRDVFGGVLFGKKTVRIDCAGQGSIGVAHSFWEGTHTSYAFTEHTFEAVCREGFRA